MPFRGRIEYEMTGIASVLKNRTFQVPTYQRSYAWEEPEVDDFWHDLKHAIDGKEPDYFLGTLVLTPDKAARRTTIIDGQQRLATTSLLLAALRDIYRERSEDELAAETEKDYLYWFDRRTRQREPRLVLNEEDDPFYRTLVVEHDGNDPKPTKDSHERLYAAYSNLRDRLDQDARDHGRSADARLVEWAEYLDEQADVIAVTVPTEADAFVIFETLNDRGAPLTLGDLLKNFLFMQAGQRLETVKTAWIQALTALELSAENELFVTFLRHHWSSKAGAVRERELYAQIKDNVASGAQAVKYVKELAEAAKLYRAITAPSDDYWKKTGFRQTAATNVETLLTLGLEQNRPLLLAVMQHFPISEQQKTLKSLVSWSMRGLVVGGIGGGQAERLYCDAAVKVRAGAVKSTKELLQELRQIVPDDAVFQDEFARARQTKPKIARYMQLALERTARGDTEPELVPNADADEVNLEHILPRNPKATDWPDFAPDEVSQWANRLGNHTLLKKTENKNIGNKPWAAKQPALAQSSLKLTKASSKAASWNKTSIASRQKRLAQLAIKAWPR